MWCTLCFVSGTLVMPQRLLQNEQQQQNCVCQCDGNGETPDTPSGDDFGMMKEQWSFVLHVSPYPLPPHKRSL